MTEAVPNFEGLLREALAPIEPPDHLVDRLEAALMSITELAADELETWELSAMRDPRNWVRPATAVVVGGAAGTALVLLRARRRTQQRPPALLGALREAGERAARELERERRRLLGER